MRMTHTPIKRRPVNLSLDEANIAAARELGLNISQTCDRALSIEIRNERDRRWKQDNAAWIEAHRNWVEANELPLERYRLF